MPLFKSVTKFDAAKVYRSTAQSINDSSLTAISFDTPLWNYGTLWTSGNPTKVYGSYSGLYIVTSQVAFAANGTGTRRYHLRKNGTIYFGEIIIPGNASIEEYVTLASEITLSSTDYVELAVEQNSGGALNISAGDASNQYRSCLSVRLTRMD